MKHLKIFENFNEVENLCKKYNIKNYKITNNGVDCINVLLQSNKLSMIPIKFNTIDGNFICSSNKLETLKNSPKYVKKLFECSFNKLTTLKNGPVSVGGGYMCRCNNLKDVYGFPEIFKGDLWISNNPVCEVIYSELFDITKSEKIFKFIQSLNYNTVIRNQDTVIKDRLLEAFYEIGIKDINEESLKYKNYKVI